MKFTADKYRIGNDQGKWSPNNEGVPREGWFCIEIEDLGRQSATCQMCEIQKVRYAHHMQHEDHPEIYEELEISASQFNNAFKPLMEKNILAIEDGKYFINPSILPSTSLEFNFKVNAK